jgi:hypothetical protein
MKICPVAAKLSQANKETYKHDKPNTHFSNFANVPKKSIPTENQILLL